MRVIEKARVVSVEGGTAAVTIIPPENPAKCAGCGSAGVCGGGSGGRPHVLQASAPEGVKEGDVVTVAIESMSPAWAALLVLILPLVVAFACGLGVWALSGSEAAGVIGGMIGVAGVYVAIWLSGVDGRGHVEIVDSEVTRDG